MNYVLGFIICIDTEEVLLIKKLKPEFQKGYLNGIGGKIEAGESSANAMVRECLEETGIETLPQEWSLFATMACPKESKDKVSNSWIVHTFITSRDKTSFDSWQQREKEQLCVVSLADITILNHKLLGNIAWLVGLGIDYLYNEAFLPVIITYEGLSLPLKFKR